MPQPFEPKVDRRRRQRFSLRCAVQFQRNRHPLEGETTNICSHGFYCIVREPFEPGEQLECVVDIRQAGLEIAWLGISLHCTVEVLRTDKVAQGYGIACQIRNYSVARSGVRQTKSGTRRVYYH
jgi:hypothetical protein